MIVYGLDPGTEQSAIVAYDTEARAVRSHATLLNETLVRMLHDCGATSGPVLAIEQIEAMGMAVGRETFETVFVSGRFFEAWRWERARVTRRAVKLHLCGSMRATDSNIRQAILDKFGATKALAIGNKKQPGPLYRVKGHEFAALAVAITWAETKQETPHRGAELPPERVQSTCAAPPGGVD